MGVIYEPQKIYGITDRGKKIEIGKFRNGNELARYVGGPIFHIVDGDNGAVYHFYDEYGNEIEDIQVGDKPYAYTVEGTPSFEKYYAFRNSAYTSKVWTYYKNGAWVYNSLGTQDGIGKGKANTNLVLAADQGKYVTNDANGKQTIWYTLQQMNQNNVDNCNDWFVPSKAELELLRTAVDREGNPLTTLFSNNYIWSSFEASAQSAWYWNYLDQSWNIYNKLNTYSMVPARAF